MKTEKLKKQKFSNPVFEAGTQAHFEINGRKEILADGCIGILHYDDKKVCLNCGKEIVEICGKGLTLHHLGDEEAMVCGQIGSVNFV